MKKTAGFTLVELIVVIAILAILAGIAIPVYSNYISKANEASDLTMLDSVKTAAVFAATEKQIPASATITKIEVGTDAKTVAVTIAEATDPLSCDISSYLGTETITYKSNTFKDAGGAVWEDSAEKWVPAD